MVCEASGTKKQWVQIHAGPVQEHWAATGNRASGFRPACKQQMCPVQELLHDWEIFLLAGGLGKAALFWMGSKEWIISAFLQGAPAGPTWRKGHVARALLKGAVSRFIAGNRGRGGKANSISSSACALSQQDSRCSIPCEQEWWVAGCRDVKPQRRCRIRPGLT